MSLVLINPVLDVYCCNEEIYPGHSRPIFFALLKILISVRGLFCHSLMIGLKDYSFMYAGFLIIEDSVRSPYN